MIITNTKLVKQVVFFFIPLMLLLTNTIAYQQKDYSNSQSCEIAGKNIENIQSGEVHLINPFFLFNN